MLLSLVVCLLVVVVVDDVVVLLLLLLLCCGYILQLLLLDSSLTMANAGGVLRSSFNGLQCDNTGLATDITWGSKDRSSDSMEPAIEGTKYI